MRKRRDGGTKKTTIDEYGYGAAGSGFGGRDPKTRRHLIVRVMSEVNRFRSRNAFHLGVHRGRRLLHLAHVAVVHFAAVVAHRVFGPERDHGADGSLEEPEDETCACGSGNASDFG